MANTTAATCFFDALQTYPIGVKVPFQRVISECKIKPSWYQVREWMRSPEYWDVQPCINVLVFYNNDNNNQEADHRDTDEIDTNIELLWTPDCDYLNHELFLLGASGVPAEDHISPGPDLS